MLHSPYASLLGLLLILGVAFFVYTDVRHFSFINYDDPNVIVNNPDIKDASWQGLKKIFLNPADPVGLAPPLSVYSFAVNYHFHELDAGAFHLTNLALHLLNIVLVFLLVLIVAGNKVAALFTAAVFGLHPAASEAVAWVVARKELLYSSFYLLSILAVIRFWNTRWLPYYLLAVLFFIGSFYAKYAGASFPVLYLLLAVLWKKRKDYGKLIVESIPFLIFPLYSFYLSLGLTWGKAATVVAATTDHVSPTAFYIAPANLNNSFTLLQKFFLGGYSLVMYLFKFLVPYSQQLVYPYPVADANGTLPGGYYVFTLMAIVITVGSGWMLVKHRHRIPPAFLFGVCLFIAPALLLLHVLPIGGRVVIADRYTYLPYAGLAIMLFYCLRWWSLRMKRKDIVYAAGLLYVAALTVLAKARVPDWRNTETILIDLTRKAPGYHLGYLNLGAFYIDQMRYADAEKQLQQAVELDTTVFLAYLNLANAQIKNGKPDAAEQNLVKARALNASNHLLYYHMGEIYMQRQNPERVRQLLDTAVQYNPAHHPTRINLGIALKHLNEYEEALHHLNEAARLVPGEVQVYDLLGMTYLRMKNYEQALNYFQHGIQLKPDYYPCWLHKCMTLAEMNRYDEMLAVSERLIEMNPNEGAGYYQRAVALLNKGKTIAEICLDLLKAQSLGVTDINAAVLEQCAQPTITSTK